MKWQQEKGLVMKSIISLLMSIVIWCQLSLANAAAPAGIVKPADQQTTMLSGTVYDLWYDATLAGAAVQIGGKTVVTDSQGRYVITGLEKGIYTVTVTKVGYATAVINGWNYDPATRKTYHLTLARNGSLSGYVRDATGIGIANAYVVPNIPQGRPSDIGVVLPRTDSRGYFSIKGLQGDTNIAVTPPAQLNLSATSHRVTVAGDMNRDFTVPGLYSVDVQVADQTGAALPSAIVFVAGDRQRSTDSGGKVTIFPLTEGNRSVQVTKEGYAPYAGTVTLSGVPGSSVVVQAKLNRLLYHLEGRAVFRLGRDPIGGATVEMGSQRVTSGGDGRFVLRDIPYGPGELTISAPGYRTHRQAIQMNGPLANQTYELSGTTTIRGSMVYVYAGIPVRLVQADVQVFRLDIGKNRVSQWTVRCDGDRNKGILSFEVADVPEGWYELNPVTMDAEGKTGLGGAILVYAASAVTTAPPILVKAPATIVGSVTGPIVAP